jgi:hypothetical protein
MSELTQHGMARERHGMCELALRGTDGKVLTGENLSTWTKTCPSATLCTTVFKRTAPDRASAVTVLSHGKAYVGEGLEKYFLSNAFRFPEKCCFSGRFPGFDRLSVGYEQHIDDAEYAALLE